MKRPKISKALACGILLSGLPVAAGAQLLCTGDETATYNLRQAPRHDRDFFNYDAAQMYKPYAAEFVPGWQWDVAKFGGSRHPVDVVIEGDFHIGGYGEIPFTDPIHITYNDQGHILTFKGLRDESQYSYDSNGGLDDVSYHNSVGLFGYRVDALVGRVQSTLNGRPYNVVGRYGTVAYTFDDKARVTRAHFTFTSQHNWFRGAIDISREITFDYDYDDRDNVVRIGVTRHIREEEEDNAVLMSYDSQNRLTEMKFTGSHDGYNRYTYAYDAQGAVVRVDEYDATLPEQYSGCFTTKYDIQRDTNGRIVAVQSRHMSHHYDNYGDWSGIDDKWTAGDRFTYDYDRYGNWTSLKVYINDVATRPNRIINRRMTYADEVGAKPKATAPQPAAPTFAPLDATTAAEWKRLSDKLDSGADINADVKAFLKKDKTGTALTLQAVQQFNGKHYDASLATAKQAVEQLMAGNHDYRTAAKAYMYAALKPHADYIKAYNEPGHDARTLYALRRKAIADLEWLAAKDTANCTYCRVYLKQLYEMMIAACEDTSLYRQKLEALEEGGLAQ